MSDLIVYYQKSEYFNAEKCKLHGMEQNFPFHETVDV